MAAIFAAGGSRRVLVVERTGDGGRKILISGGGRCNVLPSVVDAARFVTASSAHTLRNLLKSWPLADQRTFFERDLGVPLALEAETGKLFPASNRARDVRDALIQHARSRGVDFRFNATVADITPSADADVANGAAWRVRLETSAAPTLDASAVILATGGLSVPATGSDGRGLAMLRRLGHTIHETYPALTPLVAEPAVHADLAGVSLSAIVRAPIDGRSWSADGGFLFTHRGYSGPVVLDASHLAVRARLAGRAQPLLVQWTPHDERTWQEWLRPADGLVVTKLRPHVPARLAERLLRDAGLSADEPLATLRRDARQRLVDALCRTPLPWTSDEGYKKAEVTGGGVMLADVHPRTLESRRHAGLFLCGELLDAFGPIGGHNFLWAWATGRRAGLGARAAAAAADARDS